MEQNPKQLVAEKLRQATSVLVTVSRNPSVDQLTGALALTLMLNKLGKHATAVVSGEIPNAIKFMEPEKTFDPTVDGLRDFIISLDKNKADKLRYKVEDDVVKIFITPYRTKLNQDDLQFSQGDFNVDVVIALGVVKREDLDEAIAAHGRILHDATVVTVNSGTTTSNLGAIDWHDETASSLCEMLFAISESLQGGLLDAAISNALLTGIVSATERFGNMNTTPKVMTMAAQLMAAGANQQLIATNLDKPEDVPKDSGDKPSEVVIPKDDDQPSEGEDDKKSDAPLDFPEDKPETSEAETVEIENDGEVKPGASVADEESKPEPAKEESTDEVSTDSLEALEAELEAEDAKTVPSATDVLANPTEALNKPKKSMLPSPTGNDSFSATSSAALEETARQKSQSLDDLQVLDHKVEPLAAPVVADAPVSLPTPAPTTPPAPEPEPTPTPEPEVTVPELDPESARAAVEAALTGAPFEAAHNPTQGVGAKPMDNSGNVELSHHENAVQPHELVIQPPEPEPEPTPAPTAPLPSMPPINLPPAVPPPLPPMPTMQSSEPSKGTDLPHVDNAETTLQLPSAPVVPAPPAPQFPTPPLPPTQPGQ